ncbi:helix-turn-helix domain-containing protein [Rhodococcus sp. IEGM 1366]|uniref:winged helix-turn-helix transcriptional regulator n=1 Tax=Rhodococcus sp. IEGM 1366 TaxID=3082223 RepID=UPI0029544D4E|nr:helix-turn-helix domain-containing protein [Rhodococcus sp. IEGM 1366]MDV8067456.1 helix-turn-helix domain-containing protein [Rhodococcus sp. IEGM 1366]
MGVRAVRGQIQEWVSASPIYNEEGCNVAANNKPTLAQSPTDSIDHESKSALGRALVTLGDMWTVRILRSVFLGTRRFQELRDELDISDPVLSRRLRNLVEAGLLERVRYQTNPTRHEYLPTESGTDLWRIMVAIWAWDRTWASPRHRDAHIELTHQACGHQAQPIFGCGHCGAIGLTARDVRGSVDDRLLLDVRSERSRRSPVMSTPIDASEVLGDRWSTLVLSDALTGSHRFGDFQDRINISPVTLTDRLNLFVETGLMSREAISSGARRQEYRLTPKGLDIFSVFATINSWARQWLSENGSTGLSLTHISCGSELEPRFTCNTCNGVLVLEDLHFEAADRSEVNDR